MKIRTLLLTVFFACSSAWAQNNAPAPEPAADQAAAGASAVAVSADAAAPAPGQKVCKISKHTCHLANQNLAPGDSCMCGDHPGTVY